MPVLSFQSLGDNTLVEGDDDSLRRWGSQVRNDFTGTPVRDLQTALAAAGVLTGVDGQFGGGTQGALKRYQWYRGNMGFRLSDAAGARPADGTITPCDKAVLGTPGICDASVASDLLETTAGGFITTTPIVRLQLGVFSRIRTAPTFTVLDYPNAQAGEVLVNAAFVDAIRKLNAAAEATGVSLHINQTFRRDDVPPSGAVVPPAKKSQHLVGHAVDLNVIDGAVTNTAAMFMSGTATPGAMAFVRAAKTAGLRWGGDFAVRDPIHFDDFLDPNSDAYDMAHFFAQRSFHDAHPLSQV